ncbi:hypothetical protein BDN70DRAFT_939243 [Pholiota conissans]|uniref:Uncharacterized protein n=1 Tax=Pholiota conissans TaxID=109636 RepID=A0A9P6CSG8_9AGAR|nr:hypothetical protein BDN70DRAFT_939243 [Pholiota conissans]
MSFVLPPLPSPPSSTRSNINLKVPIPDAQSQGTAKSVLGNGLAGDSSNEESSSSSTGENKLTAICGNSSNPILDEATPWPPRPAKASPLLRSQLFPLGSNDQVTVDPRPRPFRPFSALSPSFIPSFSRIPEPVSSPTPSPVTLRSPPPCPARNCELRMRAPSVSIASIPLLDSFDVDTPPPRFGSSGLGGASSRPAFSSLDQRTARTSPDRAPSFSVTSLPVPGKSSTPAAHQTHYLLFCKATRNPNVFRSSRNVFQVRDPDTGIYKSYRRDQIAAFIKHDALLRKGTNVEDGAPGGYDDWAYAFNHGKFVTFGFSLYDPLTNSIFTSA